MIDRVPDDEYEASSSDRKLHVSLDCICVVVYRFMVEIFV